MSDTITLVNKVARPPKLLYFCRGPLSCIDFQYEMKVGRTTLENGQIKLNLSAEFVSRSHGIFSYDYNGYYYIDNNSKAGTWINGRLVTGGIKNYLRHGDVLHIYNGIVKSKNDVAVIVFIVNYPDRFESELIPLKNASSIDIGRENKSISLHSPTVSSNHASFMNIKNGWCIVDYHSKNGVFLNNNKIVAPSRLKTGDCIRISNTHFIYLHDCIIYQKTFKNDNSNKIVNSRRPAQKEYVPLKIHIVEKAVWQKARRLLLLRDINLNINLGEMVLVLGGSGTGKTVFLQSVIGYEKAKGSIEFDHKNIYKDKKQLKYDIGFVPQEDLLRDNDTVYATLRDAAEMKLPTGVSADAREHRIYKVLRDLGLDGIKDRQVSKLSGGQRKRLSIAVEYISEPRLFLLDEPDSGLDGPMSKALLQDLRKIADERRIVMVVSHNADRAPKVFDKVIVLAKSIKDNCGYLSFYGSPKEALSFFGVKSFEGIVRKINGVNEGGEGFVDHYIHKYYLQLESQKQMW